MTMLSPPHPGSFIRAEILEPLKLSASAAAAMLGVSPARLSAFLDGHSGLSVDIAARVEKALGIRKDTLMRMQNAYDIANARKAGQGKKG
jgi:addiction module HigA family antidote